MSPSQPITAQSWPSWLESPEDRGRIRLRWLLALMLTLLVHGLLWQGLQRLTEWVPVPQPPEAAEAYTVELVPPEPERYVEANPEVAPEMPENTRNIAAQDQVAAQPEPSEEDAAIPDAGGELDSQKIVDGSPEEPVVEPLPWGLPLARNEQQPAEPQPESGAPLLPDVIEAEPVEDEGPLVLPEVPEETEPEPEPPQEVPEPGEQRRQPSVEVVQEQQPQVSVPQGQPVPQPRPRLRPRVVPGPVMRSPTSAGRMGLIAIDSKFSEFGAYQQRMIEAISFQWNLLGDRMSTIASEMGSMAEITFVLHSDGNISEYKTVRSTASRAGTLLVQDAVMSPAPFGKWTEDMVKTLGESQEIKITFYYR